MERLQILLDVDGPLNPCDAKPTRRPVGYETFRISPTGWLDRKPLRVWLSREHGPQLVEFAERLDADLVWATTWEFDANKFIGPEIGLPELPVIEWGFSAVHWKFDAVLEYTAGHPFVWLDDDFARFDKERAWFEAERAKDPVPYRLHWVDPRIGITVLDLNQIERWYRSL